MESGPEPDGATDGVPGERPVASRERVAMPDPKLLELLVCPVTRGPLTLDARRGELVSKGARLAYPIRDGIPIMLPAEARRLDDGPPTIQR